jgi:hypothetical protein
VGPKETRVQRAHKATRGNLGWQVRKDRKEIKAIAGGAVMLVQRGQQVHKGLPAR